MAIDKVSFEFKNRLTQDNAFRNVIDEVQLQHDQLTRVFKYVSLFSTYTPATPFPSTLHVQPTSQPFPFINQ